MNKRQTVWLITRLIGVYFGYWAIVSLLSLVGAIYAYTSLPSPNNPTTKPQQTIQVNGISIPTTAPKANQSVNTPGVETPADKAKSDALKEVLWQFFFTAIYGGIGFYLIRNGKMLFSTLIRENSTDETEEIVSSAPAKPKENVVTTLDLSPSPPSKKEEVTSLNLSEYVPKSQQTAPPIIENKPLIEENPAPIDAPKEPIEFVETPQTEQNEFVNQPFYADEKTTLIRQIETISEEEPLELIEPPIVEETAKKRVRKVKEIVPTETVSLIDEQPNETLAPSDDSADK